MTKIPTLKTKIDEKRIKQKKNDRETYNLTIYKIDFPSSIRLTF